VTNGGRRIDRPTMDYMVQYRHHQHEQQHQQQHHHLQTLDAHQGHLAVGSADYGCVGLGNADGKRIESPSRHGAYWQWQHSSDGSSSEGFNHGQRAFLDDSADRGCWDATASCGSPPPPPTHRLPAPLDDGCSFTGHLQLLQPLTSRHSDRWNRSYFRYVYTTITITYQIKNIKTLKTKMVKNWYFSYQIHQNLNFKGR